MGMQWQGPSDADLAWFVGQRYDDEADVEATWTPTETQQGLCACGQPNDGQHHHEAWTYQSSAHRLMADLHLEQARRDGLLGPA